MENEKIFELMEKMYVEVKDLKESQFRIESKVDNLQIKVEGIESKVDDLQIKVDSIESKVDNLGVKFDELEPKNANRHFEILSKIDELDESIDFVKYKETKNEEELYKLKKHITIVK